LELDLSSYTLNISEHSDLYKLYALINHHGMTSNVGHFTCDVRVAENKWQRIDDEKVGDVRVIEEAIMS